MGDPERLEDEWLREYEREQGEWSAALGECGTGVGKQASNPRV
jgi:hypothetical protein